MFAPSAPVGGSPAATLGVQNPFRYRGYVYDRETGLYCLQTRYYDPEPGRFIPADGLISTNQGLLGSNMFCCCLNNPMRLADKAVLIMIYIDLQMRVILQDSNDKRNGAK